MNKKYLYDIGIVIVILTVFVFLGITLQYINGFNQYSLYHLNGNSMKPVIKNDTYVKCTKNFNEIKVGDIIIYNESTLDYVVAHKVIEKKNFTHFRTKGVNNKNYDNYLVDRSEIICKQFF